MEGKKTAVWCAADSYRERSFLILSHHINLLGAGFCERITIIWEEVHPLLIHVDHKLSKNQNIESD
jgi:hypothetical protein